MLKDKIIEIAKTLTYLTDTGILKWTEDNSNSVSRGYKRKMLSKGEDGTEYEIEIKFTLKNDNWELEDGPNLWLKNKTLPDGMILISNYKSEGENNKLRDSILKNFCQDMNPSIQDVEDALDNIVKGISIVEFREGRLNKILNK
jgi:hypothetical protein